MYYAGGMFERSLVKLLKAVDLIASPRGSSIAELESGLGISRRSVYRLLDTLQELGFPVYDERAPESQEKRWKLVSSYVEKLPNIDIPKIRFTADEIILLHYLMSRAGALKDTAFNRVSETLCEKLKLLLPEGCSSKLAFDKLESLFVPGERLTKSYEGREEIIDTLLDGIMAQNPCVVTYHSFGSDKTKKFRIEPLKLFEHDGGLYAFTRVTKYDSIRMLAVERIKELQRLDDTFQYPDDFDPDGLLESAFSLTLDDPIEAKIWFSKDQARYIEERRWAADQNIERQADGSIILTIKTSGVYDVKRWVLSFGADAAVLNPGFLRKQIFDTITNTIHFYKET